MTRSDVCTIVIIYATCTLFFWLTLQLRPAAQIYPLCIISGLALLNTLYLIKRLFIFFKEGRDGHWRIINDLPEIFSGFQARQFFFLVGACLGYLLLLRYIGFYMAGFIYLVVVMLRLKVRQVYLWTTVCVLGGLIYGVFTLLLKVPLPKGILFS